jgi:dTDP-4-amino-4,6-dideoxygalactose transaminase
MTLNQAGVPFVDLKLQHQPIQSEMEQAVLSVLRQGDYILGQAVDTIEQAFAQICGVSHGIGVACGTDAIALGLQACGIGQGDEVILPANTFIATLIGILHAGATPVFVDCDPETGLLDLIATEKAITARTRAVIPVHLYGQMVSPRALLDLASTYDVLIFEDAAQAHLAEREGYRAGSVGIAAAFSFYPSKNLGASGDGGMVVTNEPLIAETLRSLRNYGAPRKYYHADVGTNSRLDTIQAAVLNVKLPYLSQWNRDRYEAAKLYDTLLAPLQPYGLQPMQNAVGDGHIYHLYVIRLSETCHLDRNTLQAKLAEKGIQTGIHYPLPCHLQPAFRHLGYKPGDFPQAEVLCREILSLPIYPGITSAQVRQVAAAITAEIAPSLLAQSQLNSALIAS